jgi:hypothetical protein
MVKVHSLCLFTDKKYFIQVNCHYFFSLTLTAHTLHFYNRDITSDISHLMLANSETISIRGN